MTTDIAISWPVYSVPIILQWTIKVTPDNSTLLKWAKESPPPQSWWDDIDDPFGD